MSTETECLFEVRDEPYETTKKVEVTIVACIHGYLVGVWLRNQEVKTSLFYLDGASVHSESCGDLSPPKRYEWRNEYLPQSRVIVCGKPVIAVIYATEEDAKEAADVDQQYITHIAKRVEVTEEGE